MNFRNKAVTCGLVLALSFAPFAPRAYAAPTDDLAAAAAQLEQLGMGLSAAQGRLAEGTEKLELMSYEIGETEDKVENTKAELAEAREVLSGRMRSTYKTGATTLLQVLLGSTSISDLISRVYYIDKVATSDADAITRVQDLEEQLESELADLNDKKTALEHDVAALQAEVSDYQVMLGEVQAYYNSLDAQIRAELEAQAAAEAAAEAEEASAVNTAIEAVNEQNDNEEAAEQDEQGSADADDQSDDVSDTSAEEPQSPAEPAPEPDPEPVPEPEPEPEPTPRVSTGPSGAGIETALSCIGAPYVWGAAGPNSFDCSGLVCYSYGYKRGRTTYSMINSLQESGDWKTSMSELNYGDLIFTHAGHVGIYMGNGTFLHAPHEGTTVQISSVYSFYGGGPY